MSTSAGKIALIAIVVAGLAATVSACGLKAGPEQADDEGRPDARAGAPNMILIVLDDATTEMISPKTMPVTMRELRDAGTSFENFIMPSPLCCPSRAAILTGQYGHNNGVLKNTYSALDNKSQILPRWLQLAGYRTLHVGKYLNNFTNALEQPTDMPWGWDEWFTLLENGYYDYDASDNGELRHFGSAPADYVTRVVNRKAAELITTAPADRPFYMQIDHFAPHPSPARDETKCGAGSIPDPDDREGVTALRVSGKTSRNETRVKDKPWFIRDLEKMTNGELQRAKTNFRCAAATLPAVDRGIARLLQALRASGRLDETAIFLTSDNGYFFGEHRIPSKKEFAYEENLRMPLYVRMPDSVTGGKQPQRSEALTANIDLAPTMLELADGDSCDQRDRCRPIDGRSLLPLLDGSQGPDSWPQARTLLVELKEKPKGPQKRVRPCSYIGVRTPKRVFIQYRTVAVAGTPCKPTDATELYDLERDPGQLRNLAGTPKARAEEAKLRRRMERLADCSGNKTSARGRNLCE